MKKGDYVLIHNIVLNVGERAPQVPDDTKKVPLEMWMKGFLIEDAEIGQIAKIETATGRIVEGKVIEMNPRYTHDFGDCVPELLYIGRQAKEIISGGNE
jgi:hypothetical protein